MKKLAFALVLAAVAFAQTPESLTSWLWVRTAAGIYSGGLGQIRLDETLLAGAREDLADLRIYDANSQEVPYALRILTDEYSSDEFEASLFNQSTSGRATMVSLALGDNPQPHNEIEVDSTGQNYRRPLRIEGSDDAIEWATLAEDHLLRFSSGGRSVQVDRLRYPESRFQYLRVTLAADPATETGPP